MSTITQNLITIRTMSIGSFDCFSWHSAAVKKTVIVLTVPTPRMRLMLQQLQIQAMPATDTDSTDSSDASDPSDETDPTDDTDPSDATDPADESDATDQSDPSDIGPVLGFKSSTAFSANVGEKFQYRPLLDQDGSAEWSLSVGPESAVQ